MIVYLIAFVLSFIFSRLGWFFPSGLVLMAAALCLYWKDYRASGNFIHLRGLFGLFFVGGQALSCLKLSRLQVQWSVTSWLCFFAAVTAFYFAFALVQRQAELVNEQRMKKKAKSAHIIHLWEGHQKLQMYECVLFQAICAVTAISLAAFLLEAAVLGFIPLFVRNVPHAYSYFHISGVHYFTVSCVLVPPLSVLFFMAGDGRRRGMRFAAGVLTLVSLLIPVLCVSRFQLIFAVGMAVFTFLSVRHTLRIRYIVLMIAVMIPAYIVLTVARSHSIEYLNGIFEMKYSGMPIFITQPYMYIAHNYDNFNCLVEQLPAHTMGMRMLFPVLALTGLKFIRPEWANLPLYVTKTELTTLTIIYDAYYDFGVPGVIVFCAVLGGICALLVRKITRIKNPIGYVVYAQMAMYMTLSFFTTWFSNPATWFYLAVTGAVYLYVEYR